MPINQKKKIIIVSLVFLILVVLIFSGSGLIMLTARPVPSSVTQYPTLGAPRPIPSNFPPPASPTPTPIFGATWGQRLRPNGTAFDYTQWKTLRNDEYGFEVKYPSDWIYKVDNRKDIVGTTTHAYTLFLFLDKDFSRQLRLIIQKQTPDKYEKSFAVYGAPTAKENILINGAAWTMINPDLNLFSTGTLVLPVSVDILWQGYLFEFTDVYSTKDVDTISHIVKSFRFTK